MSACLLSNCSDFGGFQLASRTAFNIVSSNGSYAAHFCFCCACSTSTTLTSTATPCSISCSFSSLAAALWFKRLKYVCHPIAITPPNMLLYCMGDPARRYGVLDPFDDLRAGGAGKERLHAEEVGVEYWSKERLVYCDL
jgi:hypothetical protein